MLAPGRLDMKIEERSLVQYVINHCEGTQAYSHDSYMVDSLDSFDEEMNVVRALLYFYERVLHHRRFSGINVI